MKIKIKRAPLLGAAIGILIIILSIAIVSSKQECSKLQEANNSLNVSVNEQKKTIESLKNEKAKLQKDINQLQAEKNNWDTQVTELTEKNKQQEKNNQTNNTAKKPEKPNTQTSTSTQGTNLGQFKITAYCSCSSCCGKGSSGKTASGTTPMAGRTVAVDPKIIPLGSKVIIDGHTYIAEDTGGAIKGNKIDIYFSSHQEALNWGVKHKNVSIVK